MQRVVLYLFLMIGSTALIAQETVDEYAIVAPVQTQLDAYNTGDLELFLSAYSDSVRVYSYPDELQYQGKEKMRDRYGEMFDNLPDLHCRLVGRMVMGNRVLDHESVVFRSDAAPREVIAIYTVTDGLITEVRFMR